jgi:hypothetical protein
MNRKIHHPLWTHLPALGLLAYALWQVTRSWPLPDRVAVHFSLSGQPNRWGSPWELLLVSFGAMIGYLVLFAFFDEKWARQETRKSFNWVSLLDELLVAVLAVATTTSLRLTGETSPVFDMPWTTVAVFCVSAVAAAALLELLRPLRPDLRRIQAEDTGELQSQVALRLRDGQPWIYWEAQNPLYCRLLSLALLLGGVAASALLINSNEPYYSGVIMLIIAAVGLVCYGGLRVQVSHGKITVRLGLLGLRVLRLPLSDVALAEVQTFRPLPEFGGWGLRYGWPRWAKSDGRRRGAWAFFLCGTRGVKIVRQDGRTYLIGSDHPDRLGAVLKTAVAPPAANQAR